MFKVENVTAGYGKIPVIQNVNFHVNPGEIVLVLGPNGAGKSTLLKTMAGFLTPQSGTITLDGNSLRGLKPEKIARKGARIVLEGHRIFPELSVEDNIKLGQLALKRDERLPLKEVLDRSYEVFPILGEKRTDQAQSLSGGQQQMLSLVQAWTAQPKFLLCDEPSLGLAQSLMPEIFSFLRARADEGMGIVLVEQLVERPLKVADRVVIFKRGTVTGEGHVSEFPDARQLAKMLIGDQKISAGSNV